MIAGIYPGKEFCLFLILFAASYSDLKYRQVPDIYSALLVAVALIPPEPNRLWGILCALPFLVAAVMTDGMGGADVKIMGAVGMVIGFLEGIMAMVIGLSGMLLFHAGLKIFCRRANADKAYPLIPFLSVGVLCVYILCRRTPA